MASRAMVALPNFRTDGTQLWLINFEHTHVGASALDLSHLYTNLMFDNNFELAGSLREGCFSQRPRAGRPPLTDAFAALLIERLAGKWNAMDPVDPERRSRVHRLLHSAAADEC
jgi:hypothetical protein